MSNKPPKYKVSFDYNELITPLIVIASVSPFFGLLAILLGLNFDKVGTYGDFLGGSTMPFLTTITVILLVSTLKVQKDEYKLLREELEQTKTVLAEQTKTAIEQSRTAKMQRFETSFYNQINQLRIKKDRFEEVSPNQKTLEWVLLSLGSHIHDRISHKMLVDYRVNLQSIDNIDEMYNTIVKVSKDFNFVELELLLNQIKNESTREQKMAFEILLCASRAMTLIFDNIDLISMQEADRYKDFIYDEFSLQTNKVFLIYLAFGTLSYRGNKRITNALSLKGDYLLNCKYYDIAKQGWEIEDWYDMFIVISLLNMADEYK